MRRKQEEEIGGGGREIRFGDETFFFLFLTQCVFCVALAVTCKTMHERM